MSDLARRMIKPAVEVAVDDQPPADASADEDADEALGFAFEFGDMDAKRSDVAVVLHEHRHAEGFFEVLLEGDIFPALHVGGEDDLAVGEVHRARGANANAGHLFEAEIGFVHRVLDAAGDTLDDGIDAALGLGAELAGADALE